MTEHDTDAVVERLLVAHCEDVYEGVIDARIREREEREISNHLARLKPGDRLPGGLTVARKGKTKSVTVKPGLRLRPGLVLVPEELSDAVADRVCEAMGKHPNGTTSEWGVGYITFRESVKRHHRAMLAASADK